MYAVAGSRSGASECSVESSDAPRGLIELGILNTMFLNHAFVLKKVLIIIVTHYFRLLMLPASSSSEESEGGELTAFKTLKSWIPHADSKFLFLELC